MADYMKTKIAMDYLEIIDRQEYEVAWNESSNIIQTGVLMDDFVKSLRAARAPLGAVTSRIVDTIEDPYTPVGAPDGSYTRIIFSSSFKTKNTAHESLTLIEESDGQWRTAGYYIT